MRTVSIRTDYQFTQLKTGNRKLRYHINKNVIEYDVYMYNERISSPSPVAALSHRLLISTTRIWKNMQKQQWQLWSRHPQMTT